MRIFNYAVFAAVISILGIGSSAFAVEISELRVRSALSQPFFAEIDLDGLPSGPEDRVAASLASVDAHRNAAIPFEEPLSELVVALDLLAEPPKIIISTENPVNVPFVRFLIDVEVNGQHIYRDYTAMLDPIDFAAGLGSPLPETIVGTDSTKFYPGESYGPVKSGDTLMGIARKIEVSGSVTVKQRMVALVADNPDAFIDGNMNLLKAGVTLHIPSERFMTSRSASEAAEIYESQLVGWLHRQPKNTDAPQTAVNWASMDAPQLSASEATPGTPSMDASYVLRIISPAEQESPEARSETPQDVASSGITDASELDPRFLQQDTSGVEKDETLDLLNSRLSAMEEALASKEVENDTLYRQIELLERQLENTMKLIELQETQLALAQRQLEKALEAAAAKRNAVTETTTQTTVNSPSASLPTSAPSVPSQSATAQTGPAAVPQQPQDIQASLVLWLGVIVALLIVLLVIVRRRNSRNDREE